MGGAATAWGAGLPVGCAATLIGSPDLPATEGMAGRAGERGAGACAGAACLAAAAGAFRAPCDGAVAAIAAVATRAAVAGATVPPPTAVGARGEAGVGPNGSVRRLDWFDPTDAAFGAVAVGCPGGRVAAECCAVEAPAPANEMGIGALQFRQGTLPPLLASARATSSPMATIVEQTLHRICIAPYRPLSRPSRPRPLTLPVQRQRAPIRALLYPYVHSTLRSCYCNRIGEIGDSDAAPPRCGNRPQMQPITHLRPPGLPPIAPWLRARARPRQGCRAALSRSMTSD